jgi:hypothetical protein
LVSFEIPIYGGTVTLFSDKEEFTAERDKLALEEKITIDDYSGIVQQISSSKGRLDYLVGVFDKDPLTVVHECSHLAILICASTSWSISEETSEPFCYLLEDLVRKSQVILEG